jgi:hypothetical protein
VFRFLSPCAMMLALAFCATCCGTWVSAASAQIEWVTPDDPYPVPEGDVKELAAFVLRVAAPRLRTPQEDIRHRMYARPALQRAAQRMLELDPDPKSHHHQAARFLVLTERIRSIAQCDPDPRETVAEATEYVSEMIEIGREGVAANAASLLRRTLTHAGEWHCAVDMYHGVAPRFASSKDERILHQLRAMEAEVARINAALQSIPAPGNNVPIRPAGALVPLDLSGKWNRKMVDFSGSGDYEGNGLAELPLGELRTRGVVFRIGEGVVQLGSTTAASLPERVADIGVNDRITRLYALHASQWGQVVPDGTQVGQYRLHYEDGSTASLPIVYGEDVRDWWTSDGGRPLTRGRVGWTGTNLHTEPRGIALRLCLSVWDNPHPEKTVATVDFVSSMDTPAAPFCVALTVERPEQR